MYPTATSTLLAAQHFAAQGIGTRHVDQSLYLECAVSTTLRRLALPTGRSGRRRLLSPNSRPARVVVNPEAPDEVALRELLSIGADFNIDHALTPHHQEPRRWAGPITPKPGPLFRGLARMPRDRRTNLFRQFIRSKDVRGHNMPAGAARR